MTASIIHLLKSLISQNRLEHSINVANLAKKLAIHYDSDPEQAYSAGLIHDCAKDLDPQHPSISFSEQETDLYQDFPAIWHAIVLEKVSSFYFPSIDRSIASAAKWHSTGTADMSLLAKLIFVADYIEPSRGFPDRASLYDLAFNDLNCCVFEIARSSLFYLLSQKVSIYNELLHCYNFYHQYKT